MPTPTTKKKTDAEAPKKTQRPAEERIAELQEKIQGIQAREASKQAKRSPSGKALVAAARSIDKAIEAAEAEDNPKLGRGLEAARASISELLVEKGVRLMPRKRA